MVFSKNSKVALLALALGAINISNAFAIPGDEREAEASPAFTTRQIISFIQERNDYFFAGREQNLMHAAYNHLTDEIARLDADFQANWPTIAKTILGLAELLQNHPTRSLPNMTSYESARYVMGLLHEIIESPAEVQIKHVNYAKIYWGQLLINRLRNQMTDEDKLYAWDQLGSIGDNYTKIGNVYRASLLLEHGYIPGDVTYNEQDVPQIGAYAQNLLMASFSGPRAKRIRRLEDLARDRRTTDNTQRIEEEPDVERQAPAVASLQEIDVTPVNLTEQNAQRLRERLIREATRRANTDLIVRADPVNARENSEEVVPDGAMNVESSESSESSDDSHPALGRKRGRAEFESSNEEHSDSGSENSDIPAAAAEVVEVEVEPSAEHSTSSAQKTRREEIHLTNEQKAKFAELYLQYSGQKLYNQLRAQVLTAEQSALITSNGAFSDWITSTRSRLDKHGYEVPTKVKLSDPLSRNQLETLAGVYPNGSFDTGKECRAFLWSILNESQTNCFPEGQDSLKFRNYLRSVKRQLKKFRAH